MTFLIASICYSLFGIATVLMKYGAEALAHPRLVLTDREMRWKGLVWCGGAWTNIAHVAMLLWSLSLMPASTLSAFNGVGLVVMAILSWLVLKEPIGRREILGIGVIIAGTTILGLSEPGGEQELSFRDGAFVMFMVAGLTPFALATVVSWMQKWRFAAVIFGLGGGVMGGMSLLVQKVLSIRFFDDPGISVLVSDPYFWFFHFVANGSFAILQVAYQFGEAVIVVPLFQAGQILVPIIGGVLIFAEPTSTPQIAGVIVVIVGMLLLTTAKRD